MQKRMNKAIDPVKYDLRGCYWFLSFIGFVDEPLPPIFFTKNIIFYPLLLYDNLLYLVEELLRWCLQTVRSQLRFLPVWIQCTSCFFLSFQ